MSYNVETVAAPMPSRPTRSTPVGACDVHTHVFGPFDRFPPLRSSVYALPNASPLIHALVRERLGMTRGVLVQPAPYADDASALLHAIATAPHALRGVATADPAIEDKTLELWKEGGVVALRFVEMRAPGGYRYPGSISFEALESLAPRMRRFGFHAQLWGTAHDIAAWLPTFVGLGIPLVLDHMACPELSAGVNCAAFQKILAYGGGGQVWIKLTICRVSRAEGFDNVRPFHDALLARSPDQLLWGSDWPYVRMNPAPDAGVLLDTFCEWTQDERLCRRILVDNPARLFGFEGGAL